MNNKFKIIVDSNYIYELSAKRLINLVEESNQVGDIYIPDVVIDELVQRDIRSLNQVNKLINDKRKFKDIIQIDNINNELINTLHTYYSNLFRGRVIKLSNVNIDTVYERSLLKKPPFSVAKDFSDKGFKDSLILLSILEDSHTKYDYIILLTRDNVFLENRKELQNEFNKEYNIEISFLRKLPKEAKLERTSIKSNAVGKDAS